MKITKPSELREGMRVKFKMNDIPCWSWVRSNGAEWYCVGGTVGGINLGCCDWDFFETDITDVESYEGLMAMKEGDILTFLGDEYKVFFCNEYIFTVSDMVSFYKVGVTLAYDRAEKGGWKLKDQEQPEGNNVTMADIANAYQEINIREIQQAVFKDIEDELFKHKFSTEMGGWQIVPQLTATMQILRSKYFKEHQGA